MVTTRRTQIRECFECYYAVIMRFVGVHPLLYCRTCLTKTPHAAPPPSSGSAPMPHFYYFHHCSHHHHQQQPFADGGDDCGCTSRISVSQELLITSCDTGVRLVAPGRGGREAEEERDLQMREIQVQHRGRGEPRVGASKFMHTHRARVTTFAQRHWPRSSPSTRRTTPPP